MARRRPASPASDTTPAAAPLEFERRFDAGDYGGARQAAQAALADSSAPDDVKARAQEVLGKMAMDKGPMAMWGAMLLILVIVFAVFILDRNKNLPTAPGPVDTSKQVIPPAGAVPTTPPQGDTNGTP